MAVTLGDAVCLAPDRLLQACADATPPLPTSPWLGAANSFRHTLGLRPGTGYLLLLRDDLDNTLDYQDRFPLTFTAFASDVGEQTVRIANVRIVGTPVCVTPGVTGAANSAFLVEVADRRIDCVGFANRRYNWRVHADAPYDSFSLNGAVAWGWDTLVHDLWDAVGNLGDYPGLPSAPAGTPEQIDATASRAADVLEDVLLLHGMAIAYDPVGDTFQVVDLSAADVATAALLAENAGRRLWNQEAIWDPAAVVPEYVRVCFPVWSPGLAPVALDSYFAIDVKTTLATPGKVAGSYILVGDYQACRTNQVGTALNAADLKTRAAAVAAGMFASFDDTASNHQFLPFYNIYSGYLGSSAVVSRSQAGAGFDLVCWQDLGRGAKTHLARTGRAGDAPLLYDTTFTPSLNGTMRSGNPAQVFLRVADAAAGAKDPFFRAGNMPPGEGRRDGIGPLASDLSAAALAAPEGQSAIWVNSGPLRSAENAVVALAVDGNGQRLWRPKERTQLTCFVKVTSATADSTTTYYPAIEQFIDPATKAVTGGKTCWYYDPNGGTPSADSLHWCYLDGTYPGTSPGGDENPAKVYCDGANSLGPLTEIPVVERVCAQLGDNPILAVLRTPLDIANSAAANNVWFDTGLSLSLTLAGTYALDADVRGWLGLVSISGGSSGDWVWLSARLYDVTHGAVVPDTESMILLINLPGEEKQATTHITTFVTIAAATTYRVEVRRGITSGSTASYSHSHIGVDENGRTRLRAHIINRYVALTQQIQNIKIPESSLVGNPHCDTIQADCCPGDASGGTGVVVGCCPNAIPSSLSLTVYCNDAGNHLCIQTVPFVWDGATYWMSNFLAFTAAECPSLSGGNTCTIRYRLSCPGAAFVLEKNTILGGIDLGWQPVTPIDTLSCSPLAIEARCANLCSHHCGDVWITE